MFHALSKIVYMVIAPSNFCLLVLAAGLVLWWRGRHERLARWLVTAGFALLLVFAFSPFGKWVMFPLEERFARVAAPPSDAVTHIILLGGFENAALARWRQTIVTNASAERLLAIPALARRYPQARIIFSGGHGWLLGEQGHAGNQIIDYLVQTGVERSRLIVEGRSRNTWQNAKFSLEALGGDTLRCPCGFLLVTSSWHMPRAMGVFRKAGFEGPGRRLYAWPNDYRTHGGDGYWLPFAWTYDGLRQTDIAVKEWIGLLAYRLTGRLTELWPGPKAKAY